MKHIVLLAALLYQSFIGFSQWESMNGPFGGSVLELQNDGQLIFANTSNGFFRSIDAGRHWQHLNIQIPVNYFADKIAIQDANVILSVRSVYPYALPKRLFGSHDSGESWSEINTPSNNEAGDFSLNAYGIYYKDSEYIWLSNDFGLTWRLSKVNLLQTNLKSLYNFDDFIFIIGPNKIYRSDLLSDTWTTIDVTGIDYINRFYAFDSIYFAIGYDPGLMSRSDDRGKTWKVNNHIDWGNASIIKVGNHFYSHQANTLIRSIDGGKTFNNTFIDLQTMTNCMISIQDTMVLGTDSGILRSIDAGSNFTAMNEGLDASKVSQLSLKDNTLLALNEGIGISRLDLSSGIWQHVNYASKTILDLISVDNYTFALRDNNKIVRSPDNGITWKNVNSVPLLNGTYKRLFESENSAIIFSNYCSSHPLIGINYGDDWIPLMGINQIPGIPISFHTLNGIEYLTTDQSIARTDIFGHWKIVKEVSSLCSSYDKLIVSDSLIGYIERHFEKRAYLLWISQDQGDTWKEIVADLPSENFIKGFYNLYFLDKMILGSYSYGSIYASFDLGNSWIHFDDGLLGAYINEFTSDDTYIYAATLGKGVWRRKISDLHTTSIDQTVSENEISIFPNPSSGNFTLKLNSNLSGEARLMIYDLNGRTCIHKEIILGPLMEIETDNLANGLYMLSIRSDKNIFSTKFLVQK